MYDEPVVMRIKSPETALDTAEETDEVATVEVVQVTKEVGDKLKRRRNQERKRREARWGGETWGGDRIFEGEGEEEVGGWTRKRRVYGRCRYLLDRSLAFNLTSGLVLRGLLRAGDLPSWQASMDCRYECV